MKTDCYFEECKICVDRKYNNDLLYCVANRLNLAWHKLLIELPIVNKFINKDKHCKAFEQMVIRGAEYED